MTVLFVLLVMLVMAAPFLMTARNADKAASQMADRAEARVGLDTAARHARKQLGDSHPSEDGSPYWDSLEEVQVANEFDEQFLDASDEGGLMWDLEVMDLAGRIDLDSASPQVIANLLDMTTFLTRPLEKEADEIKIGGLRSLVPEDGHVWIGSELVHYKGYEEGALQVEQRGVLTWEDDENHWYSQGPSGDSGHGLGTPVIDQRAFAHARWRVEGADFLAESEPEPNKFGSPEDLNELKHFVRSGPGLGTYEMDRLRQFAALHAGARGGQRWQRPVRVINNINIGDSAHASVPSYVRVDEGRYFNWGSTILITNGIFSEVRFVIGSGNGVVQVDRTLEGEYIGYETVAYVLARRPVNINTAPPEVLEALLWNLKLRGRNRIVSKTEARELAGLIYESRPFTGLEDFMERLILPAAGIEELPPDAPFVPDALRADSSGSVPAIIDMYDAQAIYINALNANDASLAYSTMPFSFVTRDAYAMELRASVNAPTGVERFSAVRERIELIAPQKPLFWMWARQQDFDDALRLHQSAPFWATGPNPTSFADSATPPSRFIPNWGVLEGVMYDHEAELEAAAQAELSGEEVEEMPQVERIFADRETADGWGQLMPARPVYTAPDTLRVENFDYETSDLEGRYLPDGTIIQTPEYMGWATGDDPLLKPITFSMWIRPRDLEPSQLLDVAGSSAETDRLSLAFEEEDMVLRVLDGYGDHGETAITEAAELRYSLSPSLGPGIDVDTWNHIQVEVAGNRPEQMTMLVNGTSHGVRTSGATRLVSALNQNDGVVVVESTEGFPDIGVLRIGNELIEYTEKTGTTFSAFYQETGELAGFGGRAARERYGGSLDEEDPGLPVHLEDLDLSHPAGATVSLYGYSLPALQNLTTGSATMGQLGAWRVARVVGVPEGGQTPQGDVITIGLGYFGLGLDHTTPGNVTLELAQADNPFGGSDTTFMNAFQSGGGYAAIVQARFIAPDQIGIGGVEVVKYSGWQGTQLQLSGRGANTTELERLEPSFVVGPIDQGQTNRRFVINWDGNVQVGQQPTLGVMRWAVYVVPISLAAPGVDLVSFPDPELYGVDQGDGSWTSQFAQITPPLGSGELTEWVRYDEIAQGELVRSSNRALNDLHRAITGEDDELEAQDTDLDNNGGPGGGGPGGFAGGGTGGHAPPQGPSAWERWFGYLLTAARALDAPAEPAASAASTVAAAGSDWEPDIGASEISDFVISRAAWSAFQFRGVLGTHTHTHSGGLILPIFQFYDPAFEQSIDNPDYRFGRDLGLEHGRPGAQDYVFVSGGEADHIGWNMKVHRSYRPRLTTADVEIADGFEDQDWPTYYPGHARYYWQQNNLQVEVADPVEGALWMPEVRGRLNPNNPDQTVAIPGYEAFNRSFVAFDRPVPEPFLGASMPNGGAQVANDSRLVPRIVKFPSGERPRVVTGVSVGTSAQGGTTLGVPSAVVDELVWGLPVFGSQPTWTQGGSMQLAAQVGETDEVLTVVPQYLRTAAGSPSILNRVDAENYPGLQLSPVNPGLNLSSGSVTGQTRAAGILRIGEELLCYESRDAGAGTFLIARGGRGMLGTRPQAHDDTQPVQWIESIVASVLTVGIGAEDGEIPVQDAAKFPPSGLILIGGGEGETYELVHYSRKRGNILEMPRGSAEAGARDGRAAGLLRGRFGTGAKTHLAGTPVLVFPYRYWDRWAYAADAPELSYMELSFDQPGAFWSSVFYEWERGPAGVADIGILMRTDPGVPWDADPQASDGIYLLMGDSTDTKPVPIEQQSDRVDWRIFVNYPPGSFDLATGLGSGWRETPRFRHLGVEFYAPSRILESIDR